MFDQKLLEFQNSQQKLQEQANKVQQVKLEINVNKANEERPQYQQQFQERRPISRTVIQQKIELPKIKKENFKKMLDDLIGTRGAYLLDENSNILGKVPTTELPVTIKNLESVYAIIFDGNVNKDLLRAVEMANVKFLVGMNSLIDGPLATKTSVLTRNEL